MEIKVVLTYASRRTGDHEIQLRCDPFKDDHILGFTSVCGTFLIEVLSLSGLLQDVCKAERGAHRDHRTEGCPQLPLGMDRDHRLTHPNIPRVRYMEGNTCYHIEKVRLVPTRTPDV
ncbi:hypothetical protein CR513_15545, partial [Mucuna pruriens]